MPTSPKPAPTEPDDVVDAYLAERYGVGLERVLLDAIEGGVTAQVIGVVIVEVEMVSSTRGPDAAVTERFVGTLNLLGVVYQFRCTAWSIPDAYVHRILTNVDEFEPVEWTTSVLNART